MNTRIKRKIAKLLDETVDLVREGTDEFEAARKALATQTTDVLMTLATAAVVDAVRRRQRDVARHIERGAELPTALHEAVRGGDPGHRRRNTRAYRKWATSTPEGRAYETKAAQGDQENMKQFVTDLSHAIRQFQQELRIEWTQELLASEFALSDGRRVTWGDATVDDHRERAALFQRNAVANIEGATRHLRAVTELEMAGVPTLHDLVERAA